MIDYEQIVQEVYEAVLRPGDTALDVGAHVGRHTEMMARCVGSRGRVFAVEPLPTCRAEMRERLVHAGPGLLDAVRMVPFALGEQPASASFVVAEDSLAHSGLRVVPYPIPTRTSRLAVEVETIDRLFLQEAALDFIKLDAEGAELQILRGGIGCIEKFRPVIAFEFGTFSNREFGVEPSDMAEFWEEHGYYVHAITGERLDPAAFERVARRREIWDYVAVPREKDFLDHLVVRALNRPRVNWLAVRAELHHARAHADVGAAVPPLRSFRGPLWLAARASAWLFLLAARMITIPQRIFNQALLLAFQQLADDLQRTERESRLRDRCLEDLQQRLADLEADLRRLRNEKDEPWDHATRHQSNKAANASAAKG